MKARLVVAGVVTVGLFIACGTPQTPSARIVTQVFNNFLVIEADPNVRLVGSYWDPGYTPWATSFDRVTDANGIVTIGSIAVPGNWVITRFQSTKCPSGENYFGPLGVTTLHLRCLGGVGFHVTPASMDAFSPPSSLEFSGVGFSTEHGMPRVRFYDDYGSYFAEQTATSVSPDGTALTVTTPSISHLYNGLYGAVLLNADGNGGLMAIGGASFEIYGNAPPPSCTLPPLCSYTTCEDYENAIAQCYGVWNDTYCFCELY